MKSIFKVELLNFSTIYELPNAWKPNDYKELLELMDYGDTSGLTPQDLKDMCFMLLADHEPEEAVEFILKYIFKDRLNSGQISSLSNEMIEEKIWEEYPEISLHEEFFNAHQILYAAYNGKFPQPSAVQFQIKVSTDNNENMSVFSKNPEASLIRLLVKGMPENTLINRLFDEHIKGDEFKEAKDIIWQLKTDIEDDKSVVFSIISSSYWFKDFKYVEDFEASTHADEISI